MQESAAACPDGSIVAEVTPDGTTFRPARAAIVRRVRVLVAFAVAFPVIATAAAWLVFREVPFSAGHLVFFGVLSLLVCAAVAASRASARAAPLVVEASGRVLFANRELFAAGSIGRLYIDRVLDNSEVGDPDSYRIVVSIKRGPLERLPGPYFDSFPAREVAVWFAGRLATVLNVPLQTD